MSLCAALMVSKYELFYFDCDWTLSLVPLSRIIQVISRDNISKGSKVMLKYGPDELQADIIGVNGMYVCPPRS